jgi:hypothetical protein
MMRGRSSNAPINDPRSPSFGTVSRIRRLGRVWRLNLCRNRLFLLKQSIGALPHEKARGSTEERNKWTGEEGPFMPYRRLTHGESSSRDHRRGRAGAVVC